MSYSHAMRRSLAAGIVWISLILTVAVPAAARVVLTRVSPPGGGYSAQLPRGWRFANASYPSDHSTHLWFDPANALRKMEVVAQWLRWLREQRRGAEPERWLAH